ncbi:sigma-70 family RNA polymerase sigma factor [Mycetocola spongiae]|uniref:sigma-70 family RNA polymerase sigma factor n=1 Tax=Mycetocola spongiae TaxID=2859226 RepID=UPI001CF471AB|nr:sigma-70 family RNA polymerase sigma factor [Mycetocola spongiae]UCR89363.1 sigma-70 family RNA polymerase sigma factor [Mycetocola spongiae]
MTQQPDAAERERLIRLAYRMLGSRVEAEDVVQEVLWELHRAVGVENPGGWLTTVTVRRSIDALRRRERERDYIGPWLPEPLLERRAPRGAAPGPAEAAERDDTLGYAFLVLAESLTPPQRAVTVLRALGSPHEEIARILGISPAASRQHARRAGVVLEAGRAGRPAGPAADAENERLLRAFLRAAREGDLAALEAVLHADVVSYNDGGGRVRAALNPIYGRPRVARFSAGVAALHATRRRVRFLRVNGRPGAVLTLSGGVHILSVEVREGAIFRVYDVLNPAKHGALACLPPRAGGAEGRG